MADKKERRSAGNLDGHQLGDYLLVSKLATGGMAHIYKGIDQKLQRQAAVKVLTPEMMEADASLTARFIREAQSVAALEHENIISIYQFGEQEGIYFLAMKYVQGMDLSDALAQLRRTGEKMEITRALRILEQVASALDFAHKAGIIHRDVKPSNILLDQNDKAILTDFGLVLRQSVDQTMGTAFGTPRYISPEQAIASDAAVPQSDIYSLAVILFEILTGQSLFKGATPMEMALSHINDTPPAPRSINPEIPDAVEAEILKALSKEPKQRHLTAVEFIHKVREGYGLANRPDTEPEKSIGFAPTSPVQTLSKTPLMIDFSDPKKENGPTPPNKATPSTAATSGRGSRFRRVLLLLLLILAIGGGGYIVANNLPLIGLPTATSTPETVAQQQTPQSGATATQEAATATPTPTSVAAGSSDPGTFSLVYSYEAFAMRNLTGAAIDTRQLNFVRGSEDNLVEFAGRTITAGSIPDARCALITWQGRTVSIPAEWECGQRQLYSQFARFGGLLFWRADGLIETFEVQLNDKTIATCPAVRRGESNSCAINWSTVTASS